MAASVGTYGKFGIGTVSPVTIRIQYKDEDLGAKSSVVDGNGIRGTRSYSVEPDREGPIRVDGPINLIPNAVELASILPWILGGAGAGSPTVTYNLADALTDRFVTIDRVAKVFTYDGVKVDKATFRASQGTPLEVALELVGKTESVANAGTFPALNLNVANGVFVFTDLVLSVNGTTVSAKEFNLTVDNVLDKERFLNALTLAQVNELDRHVTFSTVLPYGDYQALYGAGGAAGTAVVATFTNGGAVLTMTLPKVQLLKKNPATPGRVEIFMPLSGNARRAGTTPGTNDELTVTLNPGP